MITGISLIKTLSTNIEIITIIVYFQQSKNIKWDYKFFLGEKKLWQ